MFEGPITAADPVLDAPGVLRTMDWPEIVARLRAARDCKAALGRPSLVGGSFFSQAAGGITHAAEQERSVNLDALACSKWVAHKIVPTARAVGAGDRDKR